MKETRQARLDEEKRETARLKAELEHVKEQLAGLMSGDIVPEDLDQGAISKRLEQLSTERSQYLQENDKLKRQIAALQSKLEKLESDRLPLEEAILTSRAGDVQDEKSELALAKLQEYQKRLEAARQEKMRNLEMIVALKKKLESVQQNTESGTAQDAGKQQQLVEKLEKMNTLLGKAKVRLEQLSSENASLKEQVAAGNESADEATQSLNEQLAQIREENRLLSEDLAARAEEVKDLQAQNEALRENHQMQISAFEDRLAKLETQNAELETLQQEVDRQKELLAAAETEKTQLREQLNNRI
jgi:chromosome segregation ATPase